MLKFNKKKNQDMVDFNIINTFAISLHSTNAYESFFVTKSYSNEKMLVRTSDSSYKVIKQKWVYRLLAISDRRRRTKPCAKIKRNIDKLMESNILLYWKCHYLYSLLKNNNWNIIYYTLEECGFNQTNLFRFKKWVF